MGWDIGRSMSQFNTDARKEYRRENIFGVIVAVVVLAWLFVLLPWVMRAWGFDPVFDVGKGRYTYESRTPGNGVIWSFDPKTARTTPKYKLFGGTVWDPQSGTYEQRRGGFIWPFVWGSRHDDD